MRQRNFTTSEEADLSCYNTGDSVQCEVYDNFAKFEHFDGASSCALYAIGDNDYLVVHVQNFGQVHCFDNLERAAQAAVEICETSER